MFYNQKTFHGIVEPKLQALNGSDSKYTIKFDQNKKLEDLSFIEKFAYSMVGEKYDLNNSSIKSNEILTKTEKGDIVAFDIVCVADNKTLAESEPYGPPLSPIRLYTTLGTSSVDPIIEDCLLDLEIGAIKKVIVNGLEYSIQVVDVRKVKKILY